MCFNCIDTPVKQLSNFLTTVSRTNQMKNFKLTKEMLNKSRSVWDNSIS